MNGHQPLIDLRRQGYKPDAVFVIDGDCHGLNDWHQPRYSRTGPLFAEVRISASDTPEALDFRWAVGMQVHLDAWRSTDRGRRLHEVLIAEKARLVATRVSIGPNPYMPLEEHLWFYYGDTKKRIEQ